MPERASATVCPRSEFFQRLLEITDTTVLGPVLPSLAMKKLWDISPPVDVGSPVFPGDTPYQQRWAARIGQDCPVNVSAITLSPHVGAHADALFFLDRAGKLKPGDPAILYNRGRCLESLGQPDAALAAYDEALSIDHRLAPALSARAMLAAASSALSPPPTTSTFCDA